MRGDGQEDGATSATRPALKTRRTLADHLRKALGALAEGHAIVASHQERPWASITFEGSRHIVKLVFEGESAVRAGETLVALLPDHEFHIPGQIVADADIVEVDHTLVPEPALVVVAELLLLRDA